MDVSVVEPAATFAGILMNNIPTIVMAIISLLTTLIAATRAWTIIISKIKAIESNITRLGLEVDATMEHTETNAENIYKVSAAVSGIDGKNGLTSRVRIAEDRIHAAEKSIATTQGEVKTWSLLFRQKSEN